MSVCQWRGRYLTGSYHFVNMFVLWQFLEGFLLMYQCVGGVAVSRQFSVNVSDCSLSMQVILPTFHLQHHGIP